MACPVFTRLQSWHASIAATFLSRIHDPLKQWKLSPMDLESQRRWEDYTKAKETMLERTHIAEAPWWVVQADDKKRTRLNCIHHLLSQVPYAEVEAPSVVLPGREGTDPRVCTGCAIVPLR